MTQLYNKLTIMKPKPFLNTNNLLANYISQSIDHRSEKYDDMLHNLLIRYAIDVQLLLKCVDEETHLSSFTNQLHIIHYDILTHQSMKALEKIKQLQKDIQLHISKFTLIFSHYEQTNDI